MIAELNAKRNLETKKLYRNVVDLRDPSQDFFVKDRWNFD